MFKKCNWHFLIFEIDVNWNYDAVCRVYICWHPYVFSPTIFREIVTFYRYCHVQTFRLRCSETVFLIDVAMAMQVYRGFQSLMARYHKTDIFFRFSLYHYCYIVKWILLNFFLQKKFLTDCQYHLKWLWNINITLGIQCHNICCFIILFIYIINISNYL